MHKHRQILEISIAKFGFKENWMKREIKLALSVTLVLGATSAFATNGSNLIGYGAKTRATVQV